MSSRIFSDYFTKWHEGMAMSRTAIAAVRAGYGVVPVKPGGKIPLCTLTPFQRARDKGHACGVAHVITDATVAKRVFDRLAVELGMDVNIGIVAAPSRLVVVDADTPEAVASFLGQWAQAVEDSRYLEHSPTVSTPGSLVNGEWRHRNGGHWYFDVPEGIELPEYPTQMRGANGFEVRWGNQMTVAPPSRRPEGPYVTNGDALEIPAWLLVEIQGHGARRAERILDLADRFVNDNVVAWSLRQNWGDLLIVDKWDDTSKLDTCGCQIWEKPGGGTSTRKSATAHDGHCSAPIYANVEGHGALHLWTDDPPEPLATWVVETGKRTITLFEYVVLTRYGGDETAARVGEGIDPDYGALWDSIGQPVNNPDPYTPAGNRNKPETPDLPSDQGKRDSDGEHPLTNLANRLAARIGVSPRDAKQELGREWLRRETRAELDRFLGEEANGSSWLPRTDLLAVLDAPRTQAQRGALERSDGATAFPFGRMHCLFGQSESGKTFLMIKSMAQLAIQGKRSLYCDFEDTAETFVDRFQHDLGIDVRPWIEAGLISYASPNEPPSDIAALLDQHYDLIVVDSLSEVVASIADGSMKDGALIKRVLRKFRELADAGASVVIIAHGSEKVDVPTSSMGASEIRQAMTGQDILLTNEHPFSNRAAGRSLIYIAKDRTSASGGDADVNPNASHKVLKRLWGAMEVAPTIDPLTDVWHTEIKVEPAEHHKPAPKERAIDVAERLVIAHLNEAKDQQARVADMLDDIVDDNDGVADRTVRRAIRKLTEDGMIHEVGALGPVGGGGGRPSPIVKLGPVPQEGS